MSPPLRILLAALLFSSGGALIKLCSFPPLERAGLRALVAALTLFLLLPETRRAPSWRVLALAPAYFAATVLFVVANSLTTAANAIFLQSTAPLWIVLLAPVVLGEWPRRRELALLACILCGMAMFFVAPATPAATAPEPRLGDIAALVAGLGYGCLLLGFRWLARRGPDEQVAAVAWGNAISAPAALALAPLLGQPLTWGDARSWAAILALGTSRSGSPMPSWRGPWCTCGRCRRRCC